MTLTCDPLDYADAGAALSRTSEMVASARDRVQSELASSAGMAGTDHAGGQFALSYDETAEIAFVSVRSAERASVNPRTGIIYAKTNDGSVRPALPEEIPAP